MIEKKKIAGYRDDIVEYSYRNYESQYVLITISS